MPIHQAAGLQRALAGCRVIQALAADRFVADNMAEYLAVLFSGLENVRTFPREGTLPPMMLADSDDGVIVICGGVRSPREWLAVAQDQACGAVETTGIIASPVFVGIADSIAGRLAEGGYQTDQHIFLYGHSAGGAGCMIVAMIARQVNEEVEIELVTYGQPRIGPAANARFLLGTDVARLMTHADPIPILPSGSTHGLLHPLGELLALLDPTTEIYFQVGNGFGITPGGNLTRRLEPAGLINVISGPIGLLQSASFATWSNHFISTYADCLLAACGGYEMGLDDTLRGMVLPPPVLQLREKPFAPSGMGAAIRLTFEEVRRMFMFIPDNYRPKPKQLGPNDWCVVWSGLVVSQMKTRSQAHVFCKRLLAWLRYLSASSHLPQANFNQALDYFFQGATGGAGFRPPLNLDP